MLNKPYPCTSCGACCRRIDIVIENIKALGYDEGHKMHFPYNHTNGTCEKLKEDGTCSVYETRPLVCNIGKLCKEFDFDEDEFILNNIKSCNEMIMADGLEPHYLIPIPKNN